MLDRVLEHLPGVSARARFSTSASLRYFPQILLVEAVAQLSGIAVVERHGEGGFLAAIDQACFERPPQLGETFDVEARVIKAFGRLYLMEGQVTAGTDELLRVTLTLGVGSL